jgi:hypothetical protein
MVSNNLTTSPAPYEADDRWDGPGGPILVEVKKTSSVRDVRNALLALAYRVSSDVPASRAVCAVVDSRLSRGRLQDELDQFRAVIHPSLASRIHFLVGSRDPRQNGVAFSGSIENEPGGFYTWLGELAAAGRLAGRAPQMAPRQLVIAALAQLHLWNQPPVTVKHLQEVCWV